MSFDLYNFGIGFITGAILFTAIKTFLNFRAQRTTEAMLREMNKYFQTSGVKAITDCRNIGLNKYVALIETEPLKKFRFSFIIEQSLNRHLLEAVGYEIHSVYWRFVVPQVEIDDDHPASEKLPSDKCETVIETSSEIELPVEKSLPQKKETETSEPAEGAHAMEIVNTGTYCVDEVSWESFQSALKRQSGCDIERTIKRQPSSGGQFAPNIEAQVRAEIEVEDRKRERQEINACAHAAAKAKREAAIREQERILAKERAERKTRIQAEKVKAAALAKLKADKIEKEKREALILARAAALKNAAPATQTESPKLMNETIRQEPLSPFIMMPEPPPEPIPGAKLTTNTVPGSSGDMDPNGDTASAWEEALRLAREAEEAIAAQLASFNAQHEAHVEALIIGGALEEKSHASLSPNSNQVPNTALGTEDEIALFSQPTVSEEHEFKFNTIH